MDSVFHLRAGVVELVDARDSKSGTERLLPCGNITDYHTSNVHCDNGVTLPSHECRQPAKETALWLLLYLVLVKTEN